MGIHAASLRPTSLTKEELKICFDQWFDELRNYITYRCCDSDLATDIVQEAYMKLWEKKLEYQGLATRGLLYKICKELWISQHRKQGSAQKYQLELSVDQGVNETDDQIDYNELKERYEEALTKLPEKRRTVFLMNRMEQMTYQEIADRLAISKKAVEKRMNLAIKDLRTMLQP